MGENICLTESNADPSRLCQCGILSNKKTEEIRDLKKKLAEKELMNQKLEFDCDALKGKLAAVDELDCSDQTSQNAEQEAAMQELLRENEVLQGLLSIKEINEKCFVDKISELERKLELTMESARLLKVQRVTLGKLTAQKEEVEKRLQERYTQVEELERLKAAAEEEHQEHLSILLSEMTEREEAYLNLEKANLMLVRQMEEMEKNIHYLDEKMVHLKRELEERVYSEANIQRQCLDLYKAVKDWQLLDQHQKEQFKKLEHKLQWTILKQKKQLDEKDEILRGHLKFLVRTNKDKHTDAIIQPNVQLRYAEEPEVQEGQRRIEMERNRRPALKGVISKDINTFMEEVSELREQVSLYKEAQSEFEDRNVMLEGLLVNVQGENRALEQKIIQRDSLLSMKGEAERTFEMQIRNLKHLLKEKETPQILSQCHAELDCIQHELCDELNKWKRKCSNYERQEKEMKTQIQQHRGLVDKMELEASHLKLSIKQKERELKECNTLKNKGMSYLTLDYNKAVVQIQSKMSSLQRENEKMDMSLSNNSKKLESSGENLRNVMRELEEKQWVLKQIESTLQVSAKEIEAQLYEKVLFVKAMEAKVLEQAQQSGDSELAEMQQDALMNSLQEQQFTSKQNRENTDEGKEKDEGSKT